MKKVLFMALVVSTVATARDEAREKQVTFVNQIVIKDEKHLVNKNPDSISPIQLKIINAEGNEATQFLEYNKEATVDLVKGVRKKGWFGSSGFDGYVKDIIVTNLGLKASETKDFVEYVNRVIDMMDDPRFVLWMPDRDIENLGIRVEVQK